MYGNDAFNRVATRVTRTQQKSMRTLDYNITDLLYEPRDRIKGIIEDLSTSNNDSSQQLLKDIDLVYTTIQHIYPTLIGTTNLAPHNYTRHIQSVLVQCNIPYYSL